jgi:hypothetical protein
MSSSPSIIPSSALRSVPDREEATFGEDVLSEFFGSRPVEVLDNPHWRVAGGGARAGGPGS